MRLLLDTNAFIWWDSDPAHLSQTALAALLDPANEVLFSVVSVWEIMIKSELGKLPLRRRLGDIVADQQRNGLRVLPVTLGHSLAIESLPAIHKDPFDRLLLAQARVEACNFVSSDKVLSSYGIPMVW